MDDFHNLSDEAKHAWQRGYDLAHPRYVPGRSKESRDCNGDARDDDLTRAVDAVGNALQGFAENERKYPIALTTVSLYFFFSKLLLFHYTKDKSKQNLASVLKVNPFFVKDYEAAARRYPAGKLVDIISLLRTYDMRSKGWDGNSGSGGELSRELVFKILHV